MRRKGYHIHPTRNVEVTSSSSVLHLVWPAIAPQTLIEPNSVDIKTREPKIPMLVLLFVAYCIPVYFIPSAQCVLDAMPYHPNPPSSFAEAPYAPALLAHPLENPAPCCATLVLHCRSGGFLPYSQLPGQADLLVVTCSPALRSPMGRIS